MERYRVRLQGHIDQRWLVAFEGLEVSHLPAGETLICGALDQAALHGLLDCIRDMGIPLISVESVDRSRT